MVKGEIMNIQKKINKYTMLMPLWQAMQTFEEEIANTSYGFIINGNNKNNILLSPNLY